MAEVVTSNLERIIPEYEMMRKHQIFTDDKIRAIVKTRENYQYKLSKNAKCLKDYGEYIIYEKKLHGLVTAVENSRKEKFPSLKSVMSNRIVRLYKEALRGFPGETLLWKAYLKFCKKYFESEVPAAYEELIQKQGDKPSVWCGAAAWFYEQGNNMEKVKSVFFRGLQRHPDCETLYTAFFNILLLETASQPKEFRNASLERVMAIYNIAKKKICNVAFLTKLVNQCDEEAFSGFTRPLQKIIITDMMDLFPREEVVWDLLARRELREVSMSEYLSDDYVEPDPDNDNYTKDEKEDFLKATLKQRIETCFNVYLTAVNTLKTPLMWTLFINAMIELNTDVSAQVALKRKKLAIAFRGAHENNCMSEDHYYAYINLLTESKSNKDFILKVMSDATDRHSSLKLWEQRLTYHVLEDNEEKFYEAFRKATRQLGSQSYPLWKLALQYYQTRYDDQYLRLKELFKEACSRTEPIFISFRPQYLEWSVVNQAFPVTRKLYIELMALSPPCLELHLKMARLEAQALKPDMERMRQCYENSIVAFGKTRSDVWINYIKFERDEGEPKRMSSLYERAKLYLLPRYVDNFVTEHCLLTVDS